MTTPQDAPFATLFEVMSIVARCYPPELRELVEAEFPPLRIQALRLALEVTTAETENLAFVDAVKQPMDFPIMARLNHGAVAILQCEVPREAVDFVRSLFHRLEAVDPCQLRPALVAAIASRTLEGALLRFLIYQAARIDRWIRTWDLPAFEATGALAQIDRQAQDKLEYWLKLSPSLPSDVSPVRLADAEVMLRLARLAEKKAEELRSLQLDAMERFQAILSATTTARDLGFEDAMVLRNEYQDDIGEQRLASAELADMYLSLIHI